MKLDQLMLMGWVNTPRRRGGNNGTRRWGILRFVGRLSLNDGACGLPPVWDGVCSLSPVWDGVCGLSPVWDGVCSLFPVWDGVCGLSPV